MNKETQVEKGIMSINVSLVLGWWKNSVLFAHGEDEMELPAIKIFSDPT